MKFIIIFLALLMAMIILLFFYSCFVVSSECSRWEEEMNAKKEKPNVK